jgi:hypothetical protein
MTFKNIADLLQNQNPADKLLFEKPFLRLSELPSDKQLQQGHLDKQDLLPNEIWIGCENYGDNISVDSNFDIIFPYHAIERYRETKVNLKRIYVKLNTVSDSLPYGAYAVCLLHFVDGIPKQLSKLRPDGQKFNKIKHEIFFLAQSSVYDKLQKLIKTEQK